MKKKILSLVLALTLFLTFTTTAFAVTTPPTATEAEIKAKLDELEKLLQTSLENQQKIQTELDAIKNAPQPEPPAPEPPAPEPKPTPDALAPRVLVKNFSFGGESITGGQTFTLTFEIYNASKNIAIENITVKLNGGDKMQLASGSDTLYIDKLGAKAAATQTTKFTTSLDIPNGSSLVTAEINFEYYFNDTKSNGTASLTMAIPVKQVDRVKVDKVSISSPEIYANQEYDMNYAITNTGFTNLNNAELIIKDEADNIISQKFIGNIEPGKEIQTNNDMYLMFAEVGEKNLKFILSYEDQALNKIENVTEFKATIMDMPSKPDIMEPIMPEEPVQDGPPVLLIIIISVAVVGIGLAVFFILRHKKKKGSVEEDEII